MLYIITLMLLISFGSIGAVIFNPALPQLGSYFHITDQIAEASIGYYLIGYCVGQLIYGPLMKRYGSKKTLNIGISIAIITSVLSILSYWVHSFNLLLFSRFIMALGCGSGLKMSFSIAHKIFGKKSGGVISMLSIAFAVSPGIGIFLSSILVTYFNWTAAFYILIAYSVLLLVLTNQLPEIVTEKDLTALKIKHIIKNYISVIKPTVIFGGLLGGICGCINYVFSTLSPFIVMNIMHTSTQVFGVYNIIPSIGMILGGIAANYLAKYKSMLNCIKYGIFISIFGVIYMALMINMSDNSVHLFISMAILFFGLSFVYGNSVALSIETIDDKSNGAAFTSFINMGSVALAVSLVGYFTINTAYILPIADTVLLLMAVFWYFLLKTSSNYKEKHV